MKMPPIRSHFCRTRLEAARLLQGLGLCILLKGSLKGSIKGLGPKFRGEGLALKVPVLVWLVSLRGPDSETEAQPSTLNPHRSHIAFRILYKDPLSLCPRRSRQCCARSLPTHPPCYWTFTTRVTKIARQIGTMLQPLNPKPYTLNP